MTSNAPDNIEGMASRQVCAGALADVLLRRRPLDNVLDQSKSFNTLSTRDRAFARMLIATVLRRKGQMDDLIRRAMDKGEPNPDMLRIVLYVGIAQILFMDVPDHAAVDISVRLAEAEGLGRQKGFVNAVLRRMTGEGREWVKKQDPVQMNTPPWMLQEWISDYGLLDAADIAQASMTEAPLDITLKNPNENALWLGALDATALPMGSLRRQSGGSVIDLPGFREGAWWVQDASSSLPVRLLGDIRDKHVIDLCAAPGGKTMQLAAGGAKVIAVDQSSARMKKLTANLERTKLLGLVETEIADAMEWQPKHMADIVVVDAPCSATGTMRRHPDLPHLKTAQDVEQLSVLQSRLLDNAARMVAPGGTLIYCTCSLQGREGEARADDFLGRHSEFSRQKINVQDAGLLPSALNASGDVRILPFHMALLGGMDGFFISLMTRS